MQGPDPAGVVLLLAVAGLLVQMGRLSLRWRVGRAAAVDWVGGLRRLPHAYLHTVHDVVARDPYASRMHAMAAGGFLAALALSLVLHVGGMQGGVAVSLSGLVLVATLVALVGVGLVAWRRKPPRPRRLTGGAFNALPAALAGGLIFLCGSAMRVIAAGGPPGMADPLTLAIALVGAPSLGMLVLWSLEGPMRHATAGVVNLVVHSRPRPVEGQRDAALAPLDLAALRTPDPTLPTVGAVTPASFPWPRLAQFDACVQCGRCQEACPAHAAGQPLNPKRLIQDLVGATTAARRGGPLPLLIGETGSAGAIAPDTLWACTTCRACVEECPMLIEHVDAIVDMRRYQTLERGAVPQKSAQALETIRATDTVAGRALDTRLDWAVDLALPVMAERRRADVLLWLGEAAFDRRNQRTLRALVTLLRQAGVDFAVLGDEERDCGDLARRLGDEITFQDLAARNIEVLGRYAFDTILTADPHAFHMLRNEYPALGGRYAVEHHSVYLDRLLGEGRLAVAARSGETLTYHDPCYLGRYNGEIAAPRRLLERLGFSIAEMANAGLRSRCCGGGGGASLADIPGERRIPDMRIDQARATGAGTVAVACPTCAGMLEGVTGPRPAVMDLAELVLAAVEAAPGRRGGAIVTQPPRLRRDPRDPAAMRARVPAGAPSAAGTADRRVLVEDDACCILAVLDLEAGRLSRDDRDLMGAARQLAGELKGAVVMMACLAPGTEFRAKPEQEGADRVVVLRDVRFAEDMAEARVEGVLSVAAQGPARHILFSEGFCGGELARRVAARLGDRPAVNVRRFSGDGLLADIDAGLTEVSRPLPRVIVIARASFAPVEPTPLREARALAIESPAAAAPRVHSTGLVPLDPSAVPLGEAALIISAGSGLTDWASFHAAARALGAAEGGSRVVCDAGLLPRSRQVGASGLLVEPRCYIAFGIAGASQHLQGISGAERVVAVNTDLHADMVKRADLAIVADAQAVLPALVRRAALRREASASSAETEPGATPQPVPDRARATAVKDIAVVALVSIGRHPVSKRPRRADLDARALELALGCSSSVTVLHAGPHGPSLATLRDYVGAPAVRLALLAGDPGADVCPALESHLRETPPRLIVAGARAEAGECSGMVPFVLAERLGCGLVTNVVALALDGDTARIVQALPGGRRRTLEAALPLVVTVDRTGPEPRLGARMQALRSVPDVRPGAFAPPDERTRWSTKPSRPRPKRLSAPKSVGAETEGRREMLAPTPDAAADAILDFLDRDGLLGSNPSSRAEGVQA